MTKFPRLILELDLQYIWSRTENEEKKRYENRNKIQCQAKAWVVMRSIDLAVLWKKKKKIFEKSQAWTPSNSCKNSSIWLTTKVENTYIHSIQLVFELYELGKGPPNLSDWESFFLASTFDMPKQHKVPKVVIKLNSCSKFH